MTTPHRDRSLGPEATCGLPARRLLRALGCAWLVLLAARGVPGAQVQHPTPQDWMPVTVAVMRSFPPQYSTDAAGHPRGFAIDVMDAVARRARLRVTYRPLNTWNDLFEALRQGRADLIPNLGVTESRRAIVNFTLPIETFSVSLFVRSNSPDVDRLEQLEGKSVAVVTSNVGVEIAHAYGGANIQEYGDVEQALGHLLSGTVDGLIFPEPIVWKVADTIGLEHRIKRAGLPLQEIKRAMGVSVRRTALLARLNLAIEELVQSAEYHEIYAKWYGTAPSIWSDETVWWAIGGAFGGVVLLMAGWRYQGVLRLNRQLRAESRERARAEEQLRQAQKMEAVGRLAGGVAHDFNNMLQIIQGYVELAMARIGAEHPAHPDLEKVLRASGQATALTRQLLAFSRREALVLRAVDVNDLIDEQSAMLRRLIGEDIELLTVPGAGPLQVRADAGMLGQVLMNLAINARDAMPGGGRIVIETQPFMADADFCRTHTWARRGSYVRLSVADTGVGMSPEVQRRIFDPFFTSKEAGRGTGLGLSMVYGIVQQHEGMISVYSEEGVGTTFHIYLPRADSAPPPPAETRRGAAPGGTETILVAEDEPDVLALLVGLLHGAGYTVLTALDGAEAIERFRDGRERIELLVLDVVMPKLGGRAAYEQIRRIDGAVPILFSSGHTANVIDAEFIAEHSARLIRKPYSPDALLRLVRETLDEAQGRGGPASGAAG